MVFVFVVVVVVVVVVSWSSQDDDMPQITGAAELSFASFGFWELGVLEDSEV